MRVLLTLLLIALTALPPAVAPATAAEARGPVTPGGAPPTHRGGHDRRDGHGRRDGHDRRDGRGEHHRFFRPGPVFIFTPIYVTPSRCWTPGYWNYAWVPQWSSYNVWVPGAWSPDGAWIDGHYEGRWYSTGAYQPYWVEGFWGSC
jgi:hypothetical protein